MLLKMVTPPGSRVMHLTHSHVFAYSCSRDCPQGLRLWAAAHGELGLSFVDLCHRRRSARLRPAQPEVISATVLDHSPCLAHGLVMRVPAPHGPSAACKLTPKALPDGPACCRLRYPATWTMF